jgi:hypothetical protein
MKQLGLRVEFRVPVGGLAIALGYDNMTSKQ